MRVYESPRTAARQSKLRALKPQQRRALKNWLLRDKLTYEQARVRLFEQFGVTISTRTISKFWSTLFRHRAPARDRRSPLLLDVILRSIKPIRVTVLETRARLRFKIGTQRQRSLLQRPTFTINPDRVIKSKA